MRPDKTTGQKTTHSPVAEMDVHLQQTRNDLCPSLISHGAHADPQTLSGFSHSVVRGQEKARGPR